MLSNLASIAQNTQSDNIRMIDIAQLHESQANYFEMQRIEEFAYTILGQGGVKDNLVVRPLESGSYEIVSGHRRRAAVQYLLDHGENISRLLPCLIQNYADEDAMMLDLILLNVSARQLSDQELWQSYENLDAILKRKKEEISVSASLANSAAQDKRNSQQGSHYNSHTESTDNEHDFTIHSAEEARRAIIWGEILQRKY